MCIDKRRAFGLFFFLLVYGIKYNQKHDNERGEIWLLKELYLANLLKVIQTLKINSKAY
jgi:hypothetical protein